MIRNKRLYAMISIFLALILLAGGLFQYPGSIPIRAAGSEDSAQVSADTSGEEIISERTESSKTYYLEDGSYAQISIGAIHYKDNYADDAEQWKDIDLTFDDQNRITQAPYELSVDTENYSITVKDKMTDQVTTLKLIQIGDQDITDINTTAVKVCNCQEYAS